MLRCSKYINKGKRGISTVLKVIPSSSLIDEEVVIQAENLSGKSKVILESNLISEKERIHFQSKCYFKTNGQTLSTQTDSPLEGSSYSGIHSSGPLWSMSRKSGYKSRLWPEDIMAKLCYSFVLRDAESDNVIAEAVATKSYVSQDVRRIEIKDGPVNGVLFLPSEPSPAIITLYGGVNNGKVPEDR